MTLHMTSRLYAQDTSPTATGTRQEPRGSFDEPGVTVEYKVVHEPWWHRLLAWKRDESNTLLTTTSPKQYILGETVAKMMHFQS